MLLRPFMISNPPISSLMFACKLNECAKIIDLKIRTYDTKAEIEVLFKKSVEGLLPAEERRNMARN